MSMDKTATYSISKITLKVQFGLFACLGPPEVSAEAFKEEALGAIASEQWIVDVHRHSAISF